MKILLFQLDGKLPNLALMRISAHHKRLGHEVELRRVLRPENLERNLFSDEDVVYASLIFSKTKPVADLLLHLRPDAIIGGTGWNDYLSTPKRVPTLEGIGITTLDQDYSLYPSFAPSIGFTQRGCRMTAKSCPFCCVPHTEGKIRAVQSIEQLWRQGQFYRDAETQALKKCPKHLCLLDNDFFGQNGPTPEEPNRQNWRDLIAAIREGNFAVSFNQGINARMLTDEAAEAIASVRYRDDGFKTARIYTAWDSRGDERVLFRGLNALKRYGVKPDHIMVYMLIGFWPGEMESDWLYRHDKLREFGARPYPMPYVRNLETLGFQRWCIGAYDKRVGWDRWKAARYQPKNLGYPTPNLFPATDTQQEEPVSTPV